MVKELVIAIYLAVFRVVFSFFKLWPMKSGKVVFVVSFSQNSLYVYQELTQRKTVTFEPVFLYTDSSAYDFQQMKDTRALNFNTLNIFHMLACVYHLATAKYVIVDNYYGFLAAANFRDGTECIQLWHAAGALKTFGMADRSMMQRSSGARRRFLKVYQRFHKIAVGSEAMAEIFIEAFQLSSKAILRSGVPRTDFFYDYPLQAKIISRMKKDHPELVGKRVILYAPTFRDNELHNFHVRLDLRLMRQQLGEDYIVMLKLHPAVANRIDYRAAYPGFVFDYSSFTDINPLLVVADYLITDYSSIPYEYALLNKPMIFFTPDLEQYQKERGLWQDYKSSMPGPIVDVTADVISVIQSNNFDLERTQAFARKWNQYSNGESSKNVVDYLCGEE